MEWFPRLCTTAFLAQLSTTICWVTPVTSLRGMSGPRRSLYSVKADDWGWQKDPAADLDPRAEWALFLSADAHAKHHSSVNCRSWETALNLSSFAIAWKFQSKFYNNYHSWNSNVHARKGINGSLTILSKQNQKWLSTQKRLGRKSSGSYS